MIIKPKVRGFICVTAHPEGCRKHVEAEAAYAKAHPVPNGPKRVLVIGSSTGYGLSSRVAATFGAGADTIGVYFERPSSGNRTATAGWYNDAAFRALAKKEGRVATSINGDAFSDAVKAETIEAIKRDLPGGQVDLVVYSLAAPKRTDPKTGEVYSSVIKPLGGAYRSSTVDFHTGEVTEVEIAPASPEELAGTIKVMGGEDWLLWMNALSDAGVLADGVGTVAYSYIGPVLTHAVYTNGTIGKAKEDLEQKVGEIDTLLAPMGGKAFVSVNKALVTQASSAIPVVPLYMTLLFRVMKRQGTHEGCIEQMARLFSDRLYRQGGGWEQVPVDGAGRIRMDDWEMDGAVQDEIAALWPTVTTENLEAVGDLAGYREDFYRLFGFGYPGVDYDADVAEY